MAYHAALHAAVAVSNILHSLSGTSLESYSTGRNWTGLRLGLELTGTGTENFSKSDWIYYKLKIQWKTGLTRSISGLVRSRQGDHAAGPWS